MFPSCLKFADAIPLLKKRRKDAKQSYRPVSILPALSKPFERNMFKQVSSFFEDVFSKHQCDFRTGFSTQQCCLVFSEKWKDTIIKCKFFGSLLVDLSKTFDAKLNAHGFTLAALKLTRDYLSHSKQSV